MRPFIQAHTLGLHSPAEKVINPKTCPNTFPHLAWSPTTKYDARLAFGHSTATTPSS